MIAKHIPIHILAKSSFAGLVNYITDNQSKEHRLGEVSITNCISDELDIAVEEVLATQALNTRAKSDKTFHLLVNFRPDEKPSAEILKAIEAKLCEGLGFGEHQRISAVHTDTNNLHIHIAINKIHPKRLTIHEPYYSFKTLAKLCAQLEQEYGLEVDNHEPKRTVAEGRAMDMEAHSGIESLLGWIKRECLTEIKAANSWEQLYQVMQDNGLELRIRANGFVFESKKTGVQVKASSVSRDLSKAKLEARFGAFEAAKEPVAQPVSSAQNTQGKFQPPKRQYEKKPIRLRVDTTQLYAAYRAQQKALPALRNPALAKARARKVEQIEQVKQWGRLRQSTIRLFGGSAFAKNLLYKQANASLRNKISVIHQEYRDECRAIYQQYRFCSWVDWLKQQAVAGNTEALQALRAREAARELQQETLYGQTVNASAFAASVVRDNITKKGTIIYRVGASAVRDDGHRLQLSKAATGQAIQAALRFAMQRYGNRLTVNGTLEFKAKIIRAAVDSGLPVTFADPLLERKRQELLKGKSLSGQHRGGTGRVPANHSQFAATGQGTRRTAQTLATSNSGAGSANAQPHAGRFAAPPPPVARDRMCGLPSRTLAGLQTGIEVLLPRSVPVLLPQRGEQSDSLLRRLAEQSAGLNQAEQAASTKRPTTPKPPTPKRKRRGR